MGQGPCNGSGSERRGSSHLPLALFENGNLVFRIHIGAVAEDYG